MFRSKKAAFKYVEPEAENFENEKAIDLKNREEKCLKQLKKFIKKEELFNGFDDLLTDTFLLAFVRGRKYNIDKATKTLYTFFRLRRVDYREYFEAFRPSLIWHGIETPIRVQGVLKQRDPKGRIVGIDRLGVWDPDNINAELGSKLLLLYGLDAIMNEQTQREGVVIIVDAANVGLKHAKCLNFSMIKMLSSVYLDSFPLRYRAIHVINHGVMADMILPMVKIFLSKKLRQRIFMHPSIESLHDAVPSEILPESLGGPLTDEEAFDSKYEQRLYDSENFYVDLERRW